MIPIFKVENRQFNFNLMGFGFIKNPFVFIRFAVVFIMAITSKLTWRRMIPNLISDPFTTP